MKNFTIAIICLALLGALSGCMHHGGGHVSATYSEGDPYPSFYLGYPWFYPWGFFSFGYHYDYPYRDHNHGDLKHRHPPRDSHPPGFQNKDGDRRPHDQHLMKDEDLRRGKPQQQKDGTRHRGRN